MPRLPFIFRTTRPGLPSTHRLNLLFNRNRRATPDDKGPVRLPIVPGPRRPITTKAAGYTRPRLRTSATKEGLAWGFVWIVRGWSGVTALHCAGSERQPCLIYKPRELSLSGPRPARRSIQPHCRGVISRELTNLGSRTASCAVWHLRTLSPGGPFRGFYLGPPSR